MPYCPICGKETGNTKSLIINDKKLDNLCSTCQSYLVCLTKPVSQFSRTNAQIWATETLSNNIHPYIRDIITSCYNYSFSDKNPTKDTLEDSAPQETETYDSANYTSVKTANTSVVKVMVFLSYAILLILGAIIGTALYETVGLFVGAVIGFLVGLISNSIIMMFVEISENTAINAETNLRNEKLLKEIRDYLKNSQK